MGLPIYIGMQED